MATFTSTLPDAVFEQLAEKAKKISLPKNKIIEPALRLYLHHLNRAEYVQSYQKTVKDQDIITIAEEGMGDYLNQLSDEAS